MKTRKSQISVESLLKKDKLSYEEYVKLKKIFNLYLDAKNKYEVSSNPAVKPQKTSLANEASLRRIQEYKEYMDSFSDSYSDRYWIVQ